MPHRIHLVRATALALAALAGSAQAHITLETRRAEAGTPYKAVLRAGHGCEGSPIREIVVTIPEGVRGAKPMLKPGWRIELERRKLATPYQSHGRTIDEDVAQVRFSGGTLADGFYDEFVIVATLPEKPGTLYWKVAQVCEKGRVDWNEVPVAGQPARELKTPAAVLEVAPGEHAGHAH